MRGRRSPCILLAALLLSACARDPLGGECSDLQVALKGSVDDIPPSLPQVKALHPWNRAPAFRQEAIGQKADLSRCLPVASRVAMASLDTFGPVMRVDGTLLTVDQGDGVDTHYGVDLADGLTGTFDRMVEVLEILVEKRRFFRVEIPRAWTFSVTPGKDVLPRDALSRMVYTANHTGFTHLRLAVEGAGPVWTVEGAPGLYGLPNPAPGTLDAHVGGSATVGGDVGLWLVATVGGVTTALGGKDCPWMAVPSGDVAALAGTVVGALEGLGVPDGFALRLVSQDGIPVSTLVEVGQAWEKVGRQVTVGPPDGGLAACTQVSTDLGAFRSSLAKVPPPPISGSDPAPSP